MARKIQVSRHGLTRCPRCAAHMQVAADVRDTICPFCKGALANAPLGALGALRSALAAGRSGLLAAGLLSLTVSACADEDKTPPADTSTATDADDTSSDGISTNEDTNEIPSDAAYGGPPDTSSVDDAITTEDVPDNGTVELYGLPPDPTP